MLREKIWLIDAKNNDILNQIEKKVKKTL